MYARRKKKIPVAFATGISVVRLLHSYCNRERETARLTTLLETTSGLRVTKPRPLKAPVRGPKRLSAETNAAIVMDYESGMKISVIPRKYGVSEWTVHHRLKRAGTRKRPNSTDPHKIKQVRLLRGDGLTCKEIAERVGFSATTVRTMLCRVDP